MLTILHIIDTTGPGGAETVFIDLATRLPKDKFRSIVVIRGKGWVYDELCRRGVDPILLDAKGSFNWRYLLALRTLIKQEHVDVIQSHLLGSNVYGALAGLLTRRPVVATFHGAVDVGKNERLIGLKFGVINLGARYVVAVSDNLRHDIIGRTPIKANKVQVIYNGIHTADFNKPPSNALREQYGWEKGDVIVGSLGNIRPAKGYDILLQAAALLKNNSIRFRFVIAGQSKGALSDKLLTQRADLGLEESVLFIGFQDDPPTLLANWDLFLLSSLSEGFSIATIQAMASGLPVVATRSGGPQEIVTHGQNGWLIEAGKPEAIAQALTKLASEPELCEMLGQNGKQHVIASFDIRAMLNRYQALYGDAESS